MFCQHCVHTIKSELSDLAGVEGVDVSLEQKTVKVNYESPATPESIKALLAEINYPVVE
jgi:copper chaperone CopZ